MASAQKRVEGTTVACPFVYGSIAYWMGKKADEFATHKWTLYVRGPNMEDMSSFISKVVFTLHPSFSAPIRGIFALNIKQVPRSLSLSKMWFLLIFGPKLN
jgi:transcription initiation factor IIF auxiliary subunit